MIQTLDEYRRCLEKFSVNPLLNADLLKFIKIRVQLYTFQSERFIDSIYGLRRGFSNRKQNVGNHWKHWVLGNLVDFVNTKYRKHHRPSSDEIIVIHQTPMFQQTQLSELIKMYLPN